MSQEIDMSVWREFLNDGMMPKTFISKKDPKDVVQTISWNWTHVFYKRLSTNNRRKKLIKTFFKEFVPQNQIQDNTSQEQ